jgi:hypothetical protein
MTSALCKIAECDVARSGVCHLGSDPVETCPNYAPEEVEIDSIDTMLDLPEAVYEPVAIADSDVMHFEDLANFARGRRIRTIALVGERKAGKTTLLASIYAMFLKGPYAGVTFAGSVTLLGFAKRHALALLNSGRTDPTTPRTSRDDPPSFFHLALSRDGGTLLDLIIADRSGEAYGDARVTTDLIQNLPELRQADRVCFLLDVARLVSKESRAAYSRQFKQLIRALHDNGALGGVNAVEVLATKFDCLSKCESPEEQLNYLEDYERALVTDFGARGLEIECFHICALPKSNVAVGFIGLAEAIERWTERAPRQDVRPVPIAHAQRQIDRLYAKSVEEQK